MKQVPCCTSPSPSKMRKFTQYHLRAFRNQFFSVFDPADTIKMWIQKSLVTVIQSLLAILVQISRKVLCAWKWHEATWNQLLYFDLLLLTSSQLSDKVKWVCFENVWFDFLTDVVCSSQGCSHSHSLRGLSAERLFVEPSQQPVDCINMSLMYIHIIQNMSFLTDSLLAGVWVRAVRGSCLSLLFFSGNTQNVFCAVRATSLALGECILILAPSSNKLLISV